MPKQTKLKQILNASSENNPAVRGLVVASMLVFALGISWAISESGGLDSSGSPATVATTVPIPETAVEVPPSEPVIPMEQQQAIGKAETYISAMAFSRQGLINQLVHDGFAEADAEFAVTQIAPDWDEQAARKAQEYLSVLDFSRQGLIDQLTHDGFTGSQAEAGVGAVGF
jgi:hypothetical protein